MNAHPLLSRGVPTAALVVGLTLAGATGASAHVRVLADTTSAGEFTALTFRVPNESSNASTTAISVDLPQDTLFLHVSSRPVPGWRATSTEATLPEPVDLEGTTVTKAVRTVTWTATDDDDRIGPGQYQEFSISVGPLPAPGTIDLPTTQTYSDGEVVRWDEPTPASGAEPEHPAPALVVTAAAAVEEPTTSPTRAATPDPASPAPATPPASDGVARALSGAALGLAVLGLAVATLSLRRRRATP